MVKLNFDITFNIIANINGNLVTPSKNSLNNELIEHRHWLLD